MEILKTLFDGTVRKYHGWFYSVCFNSTQQIWMPWESKCLGVKLVWEHFQTSLTTSIRCCISKLCLDSIATQKLNNFTINQTYWNRTEPEVKKTCGDNTILKSLYGQFVKGNLSVAKNGLVTVDGKDDNGVSRELIVIPSQLFPGLVLCLHIKLSPGTLFSESTM